MLTLIEQLKKSFIVPIIVLDTIESAVPLANLLLDEGFHTIEITLRTPCALEAIQHITHTVPSMTVGAGTIVTKKQLRQAKQAGAQFAVSPALSQTLIQEASQQQLAYLPGVATPSEALKAQTLGATNLKFFPAEGMGGINTLSAISAVFPLLRFFPTGGINEDNLFSYATLPSVCAIGGTWIAPPELIRANAFKEISLRARFTQSLLKKSGRSHI